MSSVDAFMRAIRNGNINAVEKLLIHVNDVTINKAIDIASKCGHVHIVLYLLDISLNF